MQAPISLETPFGEEGDPYLGDFIDEEARPLSPAEVTIDVKPEGMDRELVLYTLDCGGGNDLVHALSSGGLV